MRLGTQINDSLNFNKVNSVNFLSSVNYPTDTRRVYYTVYHMILQYPLHILKFTTTIKDRLIVYVD